MSKYTFNELKQYLFNESFEGESGVSITILL